MLLVICVAVGVELSWRRLVELRLRRTRTLAIRLQRYTVDYLYVGKRQQRKTLIAFLVAKLRGKVPTLKINKGITARL
jgi:hypothetical protein